MESVINWVRLRDVQPKPVFEDRNILLGKIQGAPHTSSSAIEDVRIDHRRVDVSMPQ
jgi:hypothetical protein